MKTIQSFRDLEQFGVNTLTGEADAYAMRVLCDLNEGGVKLLGDYFGLAPIPDCPSGQSLSGQSYFPKNWNSMVNGKPAIASVMLDRVLLMSLAKFALFHVDRFDYVVEYKYSMTGLNAGDELARYQELSARCPELGIRIWTNLGKRSSHPQANGRNVHAFTGRTL